MTIDNKTVKDYTDLIIETLYKLCDISPSDKEFRLAFFGTLIDTYCVTHNLDRSKVWELLYEGQKEIGEINE